MKALNMKRAFALTLTLLLTLSFPLMVFAAPTDETGEESVNITMEYRYAEGETVNIPATLTQGGIGYRLVSQAEPVLESTLPQTRTYTYKINGAISKKDLAEIEKIPNLILTPVEVEMEREVDKRDEIKGLPNNDVDYLPVSKEFEISSGSSKNAVQKEELARAGVSYKVEAKDEFGFPSKYTATVVYRGVETYKEIGYYTAQVSYRTEEVVGNIPQWVIIALYAPEGDATDTTDTDETDEIVPEEEPVVPDVPEPDANPDEISRMAEQFENQTGNPFIDLRDGNVPRGGFGVSDAWSVASLMTVFVALILSACILIGKFTGRNKEEGKYLTITASRRQLGGLMSVLSIVVGAVTALTWFLLDDLSLKMVMFNRWTPLIFVLFLVQVAFFVLSNTVRRGERNGVTDELKSA
jgi:hypothetical protein